MTFRRKADRFRRWTHDYKEGRQWPLQGFVAVVGSEAQDAVFLPLNLAGNLGGSGVQLRTAGEQQWLGAAEVETLREELFALAVSPELSDEDRLAVNHAIELVDYEVGNGTGVAVAPPTAET